MTILTNEEIEPPKKKSSDWWVTENLRNTPERKAAVDQLIDMLTYKRPAGSKTEKKFIAKFIHTVKGMKNDQYGNRFIRVGKVPVLWSSHTDTVHEAKGTQRVGFDKTEIGVAAEDTTNSSCLGADDTAGVWLMLQMLEQGVPGLYIFHRAEEEGRLGSKWLLKNRKALLKDIKFAIALDRRGKDNFITHQQCSRCCSEEWATEVCKLLNATGLEYKPDSTGSYTDTATYVDDIGECTNISVGYTGAHSKWERLDLEHMFKLRDVLCSKEFMEGLEKLEAKRKPGEKEFKGYHYDSSTGVYRSNRSAYHGMSDEEEEFWRGWTSGGYNRNGYGSYKSDAGWNTDSNKGTLSGTRVGTGIHHFRQKGDEANPDGKAVIVMPPTDTDPIVGTAVVPPVDDGDEGDHDTNYERLTKLVKRNPEATLEFLSQLIDDSPEVIADILDAEGLTEETFQAEIMSMYGVVNCA